MPDSENLISTLSPLKRALLAVEEMQDRLAQIESARREPLAIIGMGCRFPGAPDPDAFWQLLERGGDAIGEVPESRWSLSDYFSSDVDAPGKMMTRWGGFLDQVDRFDSEFFGISPREAALMDPQQRLLLEVAWEALENAAQGPASWNNGKTGVFIGITGDEYSQRIIRSGNPVLFNAYFASGIARSVAGGRISYTLGLEGPNFSIDAACSSSLVAVHNACVYLRTGQCRMALAGGVNVILSPEIGITFSKAHMMAGDGRCKTFDSRADGFVRAEGCGLIVLKRLSDAVSDGDRILALIRGSAINQDGRTSGLTIPNVSAQESVIREALANSGARADEVGYIEAHGTGTALGDPIEARALARVFAPGRPSDHPLVIGAVKTNVGHLEAAGGIAGLMKTVLILQRETVPANLHFRKINPHVEWGGLPVVLPLEKRAWKRGKGPRLAGVSAFGFSGTNAHVILEEAPASARRDPSDERPLHILALSARIEPALRRCVDRYVEELDSSDAGVGDICFSANAGRSHFAHRLAVVGKSTDDLRLKLLESAGAGHFGAREDVAPVFLFPGQGAQYAGMGKELYDTHPAFRHTLNRCAQILEHHLSAPLTDVLWGNATHLLHETACCQPALFAIEYAVAELWRSWGIQPSAVLGHSVGEYVAACIAGVYSLEDGLEFIAARGRLMSGAGGSGGMTAVFASEERVREALSDLTDRVSLAALNAPEGVVASGYTEALEIVEQRLRNQGVRVQRLNVSHAFHSPQMDEIADPFAAVAAKLKIRSPQIMWVSSATGNLMGPNEAANPDYWRRQVREPVRFHSAMETLSRKGKSMFLEAGPGRALCALGRQSIGAQDHVWLASLQSGRNDWEPMLESLARLYTAGADVNWTAFDRDYHRNRVALPTYPFERQSYWFESPQPARPNPPAVTVEPEAEVPADPLGSSLFRLVWEPLDSVASYREVAGEWLIVADRSGVARDLESRLSAMGASVSLVDPSNDLRRVASAAAWTSVVFLPALDMPAAADLSSETLEKAQRETCGALLDLVHGLAAGASTHALQLWLVTRGAQAAAENENVEIAQATVWGVAQAIAEEYPQWNCRCVDLDPAKTEMPATNLFDELRVVGAEDDVALRNAKRLAMRVVPETSFPPAIHNSVPISGDSTYLITGGFGAIGRQVVRWFIEQGARNLAIAGRSAPSPEALELIEWAESRSARIKVWPADISRQDDVHRMVDEIADTMPPLRGIIHAAGVLDDELLAKQSWERFASVFAPKVLGAWNLHRVTHRLPLDFFVMFSSVAGIMGAPGQANYAAANAFEDSLAKYRCGLGLPGTSIAWGAWSQGMGASESLQRRREDMGIHTMSNSDSLQLFSWILAAKPAYIVAGRFDLNRFVARRASKALSARFSHLISAPVERGGTDKPDILSRLAGQSPAAGTIVLRNYLQDLAIRVLGFAPGRTIDFTQPLQEMGLDSLMAVEFRNALSLSLKRNLPTTLLFSSPALDDVTQFVAGLLWKTDEQATETPVSSTTTDLIDHIEELSDEQLDQLMSAKYGISQ